MLLHHTRVQYVDPYATAVTHQSVCQLITLQPYPVQPSPVKEFAGVVTLPVTTTFHEPGYASKPSKDGFRPF